MEKLKKFILDYDIDITSLSEVNKDWRKIPYANTIWGATAGWAEKPIRVVFASRDSSNLLQIRRVMAVEDWRSSMIRFLPVRA